MHQELPVVLTQCVELIITRKYVLVDLELRVIHESNVFVNQDSVLVQTNAETVNIVKPMFADLSVSMIMAALITKNVPMVSVPVFVKQMIRVLMVLYASKVNVSRAADLIMNVQLLTPA